MSHSRNSIPPPSAPNQVLSTPTPKGAKLASKGSSPGPTSPLNPRRSSAPDKSGTPCPGRNRVRICFRTDSSSTENWLERCKSSIEAVRRIWTVESSKVNDVLRSAVPRPRARAYQSGWEITGRPWVGTRLLILFWEILWQDLVSNILGERNRISYSAILTCLHQRRDRCK